jgi:fibro-slime domain-containing protein
MNTRIPKLNFVYPSLAVFFAISVVVFAYFFTAPVNIVSAEETEDYTGSCDTSTCFRVVDDLIDNDNVGIGRAVVTNNAPSISLSGDNPKIIKVGTEYLDPGASATDIEDGDLTDEIFISGVVDYFTTGSYTIEYKVSDYEGATASIYREVIVEDIFGNREKGQITICHATASASNPYIKITISENALKAHKEHHDGKDIIPAPAEGCPSSVIPPSGPYIDLSCKITSLEQLGWYGTYYNYASTTLGMNLPTSQWSYSYGDPLSVNSTWTANWYDATFARFSRIDSSLMFGSNFFPFNLYPEELSNGNEHHFGVRWEANVLASTSGAYTFSLSSDDDSWVYVNGVLVADNSGIHPVKTINGIANLNEGMNIVQIFFAERHVTESVMNFRFNDSSLVIKPYSNVCFPINTPPTITLVGDNPITINVNSNFTDPGATAYDLEDGDLTSQIVVIGTVSTTTVGTYTLTYTVTDSQGLSASTTRQVIVKSQTTPPPTETGKINICLLLGDQDNNILTSKEGLPEGSFSIKIATSTNFASSTILSKTWNTNEFLPNSKIILDQNDADCVSIDNLAIINYLYSELNVNGSLWNTPKYNDQHTTSVTSVLDFVLYDESGNSGTNADGQITLVNNRTERTLVIYVNHNELQTPPLPAVSLSANPNTITQGATSTLTWSSTNATQCSAIWTTSTSTSGSLVVNPSSTTTYTIDCFGNNATTTATTTVTVNPLPPTPPTPTVALTASPSTITVGNSSTLTWSSTNATQCSAIWTTSTSTSGSLVVNPSSTTTYTIDCFGNNATTTATTTITVNPVTPPSGGGGGGSISGSRRDISNLLVPQGEILGTTSCMYLRDHLKTGWNNDLLEMLKLKSFLNIFEKENLELNGDFDQATFDAVSRFQNKYFTDILAPWGHDAPTGFVYITTKKKINEIYCNTIITLTQEQQSEIDAFRNYIISNYGQNIFSTPFSPEIGGALINPSIAGKDLDKVVTLDVENEEDSITATGTALGTESMLRNIAASVFAFPQRVFEDGKLVVISLIVLLVIAIAIRAWYKSGQIVSSGVSEGEVTGAPFIILPSKTEENKNKNKKTEILPDEEIIIENEEEAEGEIK